ncbi:roadblock/LC7 domain-containing protein [Streptomyces sp. NBC_01187]|uniref:roadblock/LC7 domain-containing protein n=1 Tax=unclassified Streptomyces TaxID=2593676 RepID=UPI00386D6350
MNAPATRTASSSEARNLRWLLDNLVEEVPGVRSVAVVSSDGLLLLASDPTLGTEYGDIGSGSLGFGGPGTGLPDTGSAPGQRPAQASPADQASAPASAPAPGEEPREKAPTRPSNDGPDEADSGPKGSSADLATIVSGLGSLTLGAAKLIDGGEVRQTMVSMEEGSLFVMTIGDGSLLGVHATPDCDMNVVGYHMALFVGRAGHVLTPELRSELRESMELEQ